MDRLKMFEGNACFLVKNTSDSMSRKDFESSFQMRVLKSS